MANVSLYIHIPFCQEICDFCNFVTFSNKSHQVDQYVDCVKKEIESLGDQKFQSIYFGGGTPSFIGDEKISEILGALDLSETIEVSVEFHPNNIGIAALELLKASGVSRISLGLQSVDEQVVTSLGRTPHSRSYEDLIAEISEVEFKSWSVDLILGARAESDLTWRNNLERFLENPSPHVSGYMLTVENGTPLYLDKDRHPVEETQFKRYLDLDCALEKMGYDWNEISNWSLPGHECIHNENYWRQGNYVGVGAGAHSHLNGTRWSNTVSIEKYISLITSGKSAKAREEILDIKSQEFEKNWLLLRKPDGVALDAFQEVDLLVNEGLVETNSETAFLTVKGRVLSGLVSQYLI
ncbi:MAG: radical SAM family heme chaperone HemW [Acidimicrobiales bacterium]|nr:radical SAM family heme chaperone HemW [Acidimicrobiales bacterium]